MARVPEPGTYGHSTFRVGDPLPAVLVLRDLAGILGVGDTTIWTAYKKGELARFELLPKIGNRPRFSGKKVQAWLDGEGETTGRQYFTSARRLRMATSGKE